MEPTIAPQIADTARFDGTLPAFAFNAPVELRASLKGTGDGTEVWIGPFQVRGIIYDRLRKMWTYRLQGRLDYISQDQLRPATNVIPAPRYQLGQTVTTELGEDVVVGYAWMEPGWGYYLGPDEEFFCEEDVWSKN